MEELPPQVQHQIAQLQQIQQQVQAILAQKSQIELTLRETERALEELEKLSDDAVIYRSIGELLIKTDKNTVKNDLSEKKETYTLRLKTLEKQEERIQARYKQLQEQLRQALSTMKAG